LRVPAGAYKALIVEPSAAVVLQAGRYYFDRFEVRPGGTVSIDNAAGSTQIWIRSTLSLAGAITKRDAKQNVLVGYAGRNRVRLTAALPGTLVAPRTTVELVRAAAPYQGAFFARNVVLAPGTVIQHRPFDIGANESDSTASSSVGTVPAAVPGSQISEVQSALLSCTYCFSIHICYPGDCSAAGPDEVVVCGDRCYDDMKCVDYNCSPGGGGGGGTGGGPDPDTIASCHSGCASTYFAAKAACSGSLDNNLDTCHANESTCEAKVAGDVINGFGLFGVIATSGVLSATYKTFAEAAFKAYGIARTVGELEAAGVALLPILASIQYHIVVDCWPAYTDCDELSRAAASQCFDAANQSQGSCHSDCGGA